VADRIRDGERDAEAELYQALTSFKTLFARQLGRQVAADRYHDLMMTIISKIKGGMLRDPARLAGFARTTALHMIADDIRAMQRWRRRESVEVDRLHDTSPNAETKAIWSELKAISKRILLAMPARDRLVLLRYYVHEHDARRICTEMAISEDQFRLLKSRAKARFTSMMRRRLEPSSGMWRAV
jgi:RNA polymerase sigma factor (sigma-70 family)